MFRINKLTDYGVVLMSHVARAPQRLYNAAQLAEETGMPKPTASKLLKALAKRDLLISYRGANGGYRLARPPQQITVLEVLEAIEGPIGLTECSTGGSECLQASHCELRGNWHWISLAVQDALRSVTIAQMIKPEVMRSDPAANVVKLVQYPRRPGSTGEV